MQISANQRRKMHAIAICVIQRHAKLPDSIQFNPIFFTPNDTSHLLLIAFLFVANLINFKLKKRSMKLV